jgi:hypothetical protein
LIKMPVKTDADFFRHKGTSLFAPTFYDTHASQG